MTVPGTAPVFAAAALAYLRAEAYTPQVFLWGAFPGDQGKWQVMMGQRVTSYVIFKPSRFGPDDSGTHSGVVTTEDHFWNPAGDTFKEYSVGSAPEYCPGKVVYLTQDDLVGHNATWCWRYMLDDPSCPVSTTFLASVDGVPVPSRVSAKTEAVIHKPDVEVSAVLALSVNYLENLVSIVGVKVGPVGTDGFKIYGRITTPAPFDELGSGEWQVVQLISSYREADGNLLVFTQGERWLDSVYPYPAKDSDPYPWAADGSPHDTVDSPRQGAANSFDIGENFWMYVLYKPGWNADWAPIVYRHWDWYAGAENTESGWPKPVPGGTNLDPPVDTYSEHPEWTQRVVSSG